MPRVKFIILVSFLLSLMLVASSVPRATTQSPALELIESDDGRVQREGAWTLQATPSASGGSYLYSSGATTDALTLHFAGTTVTVVYVAHPAFGVLALEIDGTLVRTVDTYHDTAVFNARTAVDYLAPGAHVLRVYAVSGTIGLDAFETIPAMSLLWQDDFTDAGGWFFSPGPFAAQPDGSLTALQLGDGVYAAYLKPGGLAHFEVQARFAIQQGSLRLNTHISEAGRYTTVIDPAGQVAFYQDETLLASAIITALGLDDWHTLRFVANQGSLRLSLDGTEVLAVIDATPLPAGMLAFAVESTANAFLVDDFYVWVPQAERRAVAPEPPGFPAMVQAAITAVASGGGKIVFAYASGNLTSSGLFIANADGSGAVMRLENTSWIDGYQSGGLDITADGSRIVFSSPRNGPRDLYVINVDGTDLRQVTQDNGDDTWPAWSPDEDRIALTSTTGPNQDDGIYVIDLTTCGNDYCTKTPLTGNSNDVLDVSPTWSPDGSEIAFISGRSGYLNIHAVAVSGGSVRQLTHITNNDAYASVAWSPADGNMLAATYERWISITESDVDVVLISAAGGTMGTVTALPGSSRHPAWSQPGSEQLAFHYQLSGMFGLYSNVFTVTRTGGDYEQITEFSEGHVTALAWGGAVICPAGAVFVGPGNPNPCILPSPTPSPLPTNTPLASDTPTAIPPCRATVLPAGGLAFRYTRIVSENTRVLVIRNYQTEWQIVDQLYTFPGQWDNVAGGDPADWPVGTLLTLEATSWSQTADGIVWLGMVATNQQSASISGYMALRTPPNNDNLLALSCPESSLPGYAGPPPTSTPGPSPTPNVLDWYVICTLRPGEQPPIEVNVRRAPNTSSEILAILGPGARVRRTSLNLADEVMVGNFIFVELEWAGGPNGRAWIARQDSLGALLVDNRNDPNCPIPTPTPTPTVPPPTPNPSIPRFSPGRFDDNVSAIVSPFSGQSPAVVGGLRFHDGTLDVVPRNFQDGRNPSGDIYMNVEHCIDSSLSADLGICDPNGSQEGMAIYSPIPGCAIRYQEEPYTITILFNCEGYQTFSDANGTVNNVRRELVLIHIDPLTSLVPAGTYAQAILYPVGPGTLLGTICREEDKIRCDVRGSRPTHLAVKLRFNPPYNPGGPGPVLTTETEIRGFLATPNCLFDDWNFSPGNPRLETAPLNGCPVD